MIPECNISYSMKFLKVLVATLVATLLPVALLPVIPMLTALLPAALLPVLMPTTEEHKCPCQVDAPFPVLHKCMQCFGK